MITGEDALAALNELRSNVVATQNAGWSNTIYPFVAILNASGQKLFDSSPRQMREHLSCYGGAGGYPGHLKPVPVIEHIPLVGCFQHLVNVTDKFLTDPTDEHRGYVEYTLKRSKEILAA